MKPTFQGWTIEHFKRFFSHNDIEKCIEDFKEKFPEIKMVSIIEAYRHKEDAKRRYIQLKSVVPPAPPLPPPPLNKYVTGKTKEKYEHIRKAILSLNLEPDTPLPWQKIHDIVSADIKISMGSIKSIVYGYGSYEYLRGLGIFDDIITVIPTTKGSVLVAKDRSLIQKPPAEKSGPTEKPIMVPAKIVHKYDVTKKAESFVDEDAVIVKTHNLHAEQVQLLKENLSTMNELVKVVKMQTDALNGIKTAISTLNITTNNANTFVVRAIERNTDISEKTLALFEVLSKKK